MPKPVKIKKKKSFMFTTKHHSFLGVLGAILCILSLFTLCWCVYMSFVNRGHIGNNFGAVGFFAALVDVIGIIGGFLALNERDIHRWLPIASIAGNSGVLAVWVSIIILGLHGV